jgi:hypothetical protein
MARMPERKPTTILSWPIARELAVRAKCDPRTVQEAARGLLGKGDPAVRARCVVADYFDLNPQQRPPGWKRPPEQPIPYQTARAIARELGVSPSDVQSAARGLPIYDEHEDKALDLHAKVEAYFAAHPEHRPAGVGLVCEVRP